MSVENYYKTYVFIAYLESIISSLSVRVQTDNNAAFSLTVLHPQHFINFNSNQLNDQVKMIEQHFEIENFQNEASTWFDYLKIKNGKLNSLKMADLLSHCEFLPAVATAATYSVTYSVL